MITKTDYNTSGHAFTAKRLLLGFILCWIMSLLSMGCIGGYMYKLQRDDARRDEVFDFSDVSSDDPFKKDSPVSKTAGMYALVYMIRSALTLYLFYCLSLWRKITRLKRYSIPALIGVAAFIIQDIYFFPLETGTTFYNAFAYVGLYLFAALVFTIEFIIIDFLARRFVDR